MTMTTTSADDLILVRHGETVGNSSIRYYGATDVALSPIGEAQMTRVGEALRGERFERVIASTLGRSRRGAAIVRAALAPPAPPLVVVANLRERDFGAWEGWTAEEIAARDPEGHRAWIASGPDFRYPGGESRHEVHARVGEALADLDLAGGGRTLAVLHKGIIKVILRALLGLGEAEAAALPVALGSVHRLARGGGGWRLTSANEVAHLGDLDLGG